MYFKSENKFMKSSGPLGGYYFMEDKIRQVLLYTQYEVCEQAPFKRPSRMQGQFGFWKWFEAGVGAWASSGADVI
jgi:hypothetical protein